jgi:hypothetical protein
MFRLYTVELKAGPFNSGGQRQGSFASRTFWQSFWFLGVFFTVWPIQGVGFVVPTVPSTSWIHLMAAMFGPRQGFWNVVSVFLRD